MKKFDTISKGELKKHAGCKCDLITDDGTEIKDGLIYLKDDYVFVVHNGKDANGSRPDIIPKGYKYSWCIYHDKENDDAVDNDAYISITIYDTEKKSRSKYERQAIGSDGTVFTKTSIGNRTLEEITKSIQERKDSISRDEKLLRTHRSLFSKKR